MDRSRITPELVRCLVRDQFPRWAELPVTPVELSGWDNATFRLGDTMSVRLPTAEGYVPQVDKEHRWLPYLAPRLPLPVPVPLARGEPGRGYPWPWSVYRWLDGRPALPGAIADLDRFARDLAGFLGALHEVDATDGPPAGEHSAHRGGHPSTYDAETRAAVDELDDEIDTDAALAVWEAVLAAEWRGPPVWVHGDMTPSNLLAVDGRLAAVIDFGACAVGDPACDTAIAWTLFTGSSRDVFRRALPVDDATLARGRGWALWKALITHAEARRRGPEAVATAGLKFGWRANARAIVEDLIGGQ